MAVWAVQGGNKQISAVIMDIGECHQYNHGYISNITKHAGAELCQAQD